MSSILSFASTAVVAAVSAVGYVIGALFIAAMLGGGVYKTECTLPDGRHAEGWALGDSIPYLWDAGDGCEEHTLTRVLLSEAGVMEPLP